VPDSPLVPLSTEFELARQYLEVMKARLEDRLQFAIECEAGAESAQVPALLLQPLVENAIEHGQDPVSGHTEVAKLTRICTYDRAGYAWSDRGPIDDGIEEIVGDLNLLLRTAHINPPYVLVGHSLGSLYIRTYQRRFPEQVVGLVFVDGTPDEDVRMVLNGKQVAISLLTREKLPAAHREYLNAVPR